MHGASVFNKFEIMSSSFSVISLMPKHVKIRYPLRRTYLNVN